MNDFLNLIEQLLKEVLEETLKIKSEKSDCQKFYYEVLYMNIRLYEGAVFLLNQFKERPLFQVAFVSIMRDLISNLILAEYISYKEYDKLANVEMELEKIYSEHYRFKKKNKGIEKILFGNYENYTQDEENFDKLGERYNGDDGQLKSHLKKLPSTYDRIKYIESKQKKDDKDNIRILYLWYTAFSKIAHFGELTVHRVVDNYISKDEKEVFEKYSYLLQVVSKYIVGLLVKVTSEHAIEDSIGDNLREILNFEFST